MNLWNWLDMRPWRLRYHFLLISIGFAIDIGPCDGQSMEFQTNWELSRTCSYQLLTKRVVVINVCPSWFNSSFVNRTLNSESRPYLLSDNQDTKLLRRSQTCQFRSSTKKRGLVGYNLSIDPLKFEQLRSLSRDSFAQFAQKGKNKKQCYAIFGDSIGFFSIFYVMLK